MTLQQGIDKYERVLGREGNDPIAEDAIEVEAEPDELDEDARGPRDDGDPDGSWTDLVRREEAGEFNDTVETVAGEHDGEVWGDAAIWLLQEQKGT